MFKANVVYSEDLDALIAKLKEFDPKLQKQLQKELTDAVKPVRDLARKFVPSEGATNWTAKEPTYPAGWGWATDQVHRNKKTYDGKSIWSFNQGDIKSGIKISKAKSKVMRIRGATFGVTALALINSNVGGIIYELAGYGKRKSRSNSSRNPNAKTDFVRAIKTDAEPGQKRLIYRAANAMGNMTTDKIQKVVDRWMQNYMRK